MKFIICMFVQIMHVHTSTYIHIHLYTLAYVGFQRDYRKVHKMEETKIDTIFNKGMYMCMYYVKYLTYVATCVATVVQTYVYTYIHAH